MLTLFDIPFIITALIILVIGISRLKALKSFQKKEALSRDFKGLIGYLAGHHKLLERPITGTFHFILFWGCVLFTLMIIPAQFGLVFPKGMAQGISFVMDITGFFMLLAVLYFMIRLFPVDREKQIPGKFLLLFVLLTILLTGFLSAGTRLKIIQAGFSAQSPVGSLFSVFSPDSPLFMQLMIRFHFLGVLVFFSLLPFSFFRHIPTGIQNVFQKHQTHPGELSPVQMESYPIGAETIFDFSQKQLLGAQACVSCKRCREHCPAAISGKPLNPDRIMAVLFDRMTQDAGRFHNRQGVPDLEQDITIDEIWACTTCMACTTHCPMMISPMDMIMALRRHQVLDKGQIPHEARQMLRNLELFGDTYGKGRAHRTDWRTGISAPEVRELTDRPDVLLWIGCSGAFHPRYTDVTRNMAGILEAAGICFAIPGKDELCCGDGARRLGEESVFRHLARKNIDTLNGYGIGTIIVFCPHCFNTIKNEYPALGGTYKVISAIEYLLTLIDEGKITPTYPIHSRITLHDPCYLGRINGIYDPLRKLIKKLPGLTLEELPRSFDAALCCGGGGGRMWLHESLGENINHIRSREIMATGVDLLGTACPFCMTMMQDGMGSLEADTHLKIMDLIEITAHSIGVMDKEKS